jgi:hypothetical protein
MKLAVRVLRRGDGAVEQAEAAAALVGAYLSARLADGAAGALSSADGALLDALMSPLESSDDLDYDEQRVAASRQRGALAALDAVLPLVRLRAVDQRITAQQWRGMAALLRHPSAAVRRRLLDALAPVVAQRQVVPLRYVALLAVAVGADPERELREQAKAALARAVEMRAQLSAHATLPAAAKATFLPEYALPWMAHLLASTLATRRELAAFVGGAGDAAALPQLAAITDELLLTVLDAQRDYSFAWRVCVSASRARDIAGGARFTQAVCELLAKQIHKASQSAASWRVSELADDDIFLPECCV